MNLGWTKLRWSKWEGAMCCELLLCNEMTIIEFIQITFLQKSVLNYLSINLTILINLTRKKKHNFSTPSTDVCVKGPLFMFWQWDFGIFLSGPHPSCFTADLYCYYSKLQTQLPVNRVLGFAFMVCWHLGSISSHWEWAFTSGWVHMLTQ